MTHINRLKIYAAAIGGALLLGLSGVADAAEDVHVCANIENNLGSVYRATKTAIDGQSVEALSSIEIRIDNAVREGTLNEDHGDVLIVSFYYLVDFVINTGTWPTQSQFQQAGKAYCEREHGTTADRNNI